jgi:hypothetical protein
MEALQRMHNRGSISTGYDINNSLKFETDNTEYLMAEGRPQGTQTTWTWSCWLKRTEVNNGAVAQYIFSAGSDGKTGIYFRDDASYPDDRIFIYVDEGNSLKWIGQVNQSFRDTSAWYHIVFAVDSTDGTAADRTKLYINGVQQTITFNATLNQNVSTRVGDGGGKFSIGGKVADTGYGFNGYIAECVLVDGSALTPTSFGEFDNDSNIWKPKDVSSLSLGTAGFHMNFDDSSNVGAVKTGTSQGNFDKYNLTAADQATDTPTNNFTTFNTLRRWNQDRISITEGASVVNTVSGNAWTTVSNNIGVNKGKWYWEGELYAGGGYQMFGQNPVVSTEININTDWYLGQYANKSAGAGYYGSGADVYYEGTYANSSANATGDIISVAMDCDNNRVHFAVNGTYTNNSDPVNDSYGFAMTDDYQYFAMATYIGSYAFKANFGGFTTISISSAASDANGYGTFEYAPPSGYYALCTKNLEEFG